MNILSFNFLISLILLIFLGKIGSVAPKELRFRKIPSKDIRHVKNHSKDILLTRSSIPSHLVITPWVLRPPFIPHWALLYNSLSFLLRVALASRSWRLKLATSQPPARALQHACSAEGERQPPARALQHACSAEGELQPPARALQRAGFSGSEHRPCGRCSRPARAPQHGCMGAHERTTKDVNPSCGVNLVSASL
jgi:hypothetical protein